MTSRPPQTIVAYPAMVLGLVLPLLGGCATGVRRPGACSCCIQGKPVIRRQPVWWHLFDVTVLEPLEQSFHLVRPARKLAGVPVRALNLRHGRVTGSLFFTDRDPAGLTPEQVRWGPTGTGDRLVPPLTITKSKMEGKTSGFFVTDAEGRRYLLKLDPVEAPELLSGAEVVTSKLLYALGYRVPSYEAVRLRAEDFRIAPEATVKGNPSHHGRLFTDADLAGLLAPRLRDGAVRVCASKIVDGEILGPARFKQFRDCAEVRALKIAYAWVNNIDAKDHNSLLVWTGDHVEGYLIDFGTSLGADAGLGGPKTACAGWTNIVDLKELSLELVTLGLHRPACDPDHRPHDRTVGLFSPRVDPERWKPYVPNLAFNEMNEDDAEWIARRMARLSRARIEAAVAAGQYSDPADAAYLVETLEQRRQAILRRYVEKENIP